MSEIAKCALCGKEPNKNKFFAFDEVDYYCCSISCSELSAWNRVQAALRGDKALEELKEAVRLERECEELNSIITEKYACTSESAPEEDEISVSYFMAIAAVDALCGGGE